MCKAVSVLEVVSVFVAVGVLVVVGATVVLAVDIGPGSALAICDKLV